MFILYVCISLTSADSEWFAGCGGGGCCRSFSTFECEQVFGGFHETTFFGPRNGRIGGVVSVPIAGIDVRPPAEVVV